MLKNIFFDKKLNLQSNFVYYIYNRSIFNS